ncbi:MAG: site-2 protease family protein [Verrucomicrobiales bacterium]|nr:site-2 protease family protein [Verrucomicrobiales bacterium]
MNGAYKLGSPFGIGLYVHWTFGLLLAFLLLTGAGFAGLLFVLAIFACVTLHEYGHALAARHYRIATDSITLYPIGGIARLAFMPHNPKQELVIALAGPAVNVVIAALLLPLAILFTGDFTAIIPGSPGGFFAQLVVANISLVVFNLIPAFPMDGGRVFRALLSMRRDYASATDIAARTGQGIAVAFGLFGLFTGEIFLLAIAVFIYMAAGAERRMASLHARFASAPPPPVPTGDSNWEVLPPESQPAQSSETTPPNHQPRQRDQSQKSIFEAIKKGFSQPPPPTGRRP